MPIFFVFLFSHLLTYTNPTILTDAKQWVRVLLLLRFFEPFVFTAIIPPKKFIVITIIIVMTTIIILIVIIPHIYSLPCEKPIRAKLQRGRIIFHYFITHFLF